MFGLYLLVKGRCVWIIFASQRTVCLDYIASQRMVCLDYICKSKDGVFGLYCCALRKYRSEMRKYCCALRKYCCALRKYCCALKKYCCALRIVFKYQETSKCIQKCCALRIWATVVFVINLP